MYKRKIEAILQEWKNQTKHAIKCGDYNIGRQGALLTIPFYMAFLLKEL